MLGGINLKNLLSAGLSAMPVDSDGVPFDMSHIYASGNIAADMPANVTAESTGRILAVRLNNMTSDPGMKDMLSFLIAGDTMHQNHWLAALEELGGPRTCCRSPTASRSSAATICNISRRCRKSPPRPAPRPRKRATGS